MAYEEKSPSELPAIYTRIKTGVEQPIQLVAIGTGEPGVSTSYVPGDFVVHDGVVWIANFNSDNVPPGGAYDLAGTDLPDSAPNWEVLTGLK